MSSEFAEATEQSLTTLKKALFGEEIISEFKGHDMNRIGTAEREIIGSSLNPVTGILGSVSDVDYSGEILFPEGISTYVFALDRAFYTLKRTGKLKNLAGLVIGKFVKVREVSVGGGDEYCEGV